MRWIAVAALAAGCTVGSVAAEQAPTSGSSAAQIAAKNVAARGGLVAWRKVQTMIWAGHMESPRAPVPDMQFVLSQQRPNKTRFEILAHHQRSVRVFDGARGWKVRPTPDGRVDMQPYTPQELMFARAAQGIDGPLIDYEAKGIAVALDGIEEVEGHKAFRLKLTLPSGERHNVWIDAQTFLDLKYDRTSYTTAGVAGTLTVFCRNYQTYDGLEIPTILEIGGGSGKTPDKMVIERVAVNPPLDERTFSKPGSPGEHHGHALGPTQALRLARPRAEAPIPPAASNLNSGPVQQ
jgi:hypothetical protein